MAESTALAEHRDVDSERHDGRTVYQGELGTGVTTPATDAAAAMKDAGALETPGTPEPFVAEELLVEEVSIDGMCGVY